jgi:hypothetical protein
MQSFYNKSAAKIAGLRLTLKQKNPTLHDYCHLLGLGIKVTFKLGKTITPMEQSSDLPAFSLFS